jgi:hypothetical protein
MDETFQQACLLMDATVEGQFLTGLILPPGSTLPTTDQGPIAMGGQWYFWNTNTNSYQIQTAPRASKNIVKNGGYQIQQTGPAPVLTPGVNKAYDMALTRMTASGVLMIAADVGPLAGADYDTCPAAIKYTVGTPVATLASTDNYLHEHLIEGPDLAPIANQVLSLSFLCWVNQPGTYSAYLASGARDASYCVTFQMPTANTWNRIKIQGIPAIPSIGTWNYAEGATGMYIGVTMASGAQWTTANTGQWNGALFVAGTGQSNMVGVTNNQMKITAVRLEAGAQCGYASLNSFAADYEECIRYYWTGYNYQSTTVGMWTMMVSHIGSNANGTFFWPRRMAKTPAVSFFSPNTNTVNHVYNFSTAADVSGSSAAASSQKGVFVNMNGGISKGDVLGVIFTADARLT